MADFAFLIVLVIITIVVIVASAMLRVLLKKDEDKQASALLKTKDKVEKMAELGKSVKQIQWGDQFVVDEGMIDQDHQILFGLINKFNASIPRFHTAKQMTPYLETLKKYTQVHFQREERLQEISGFPFHEEHKQAHETLIIQLDDLIRKAGRAKDDDVTKVALEIGDFLQVWLSDHVVDNDLTMKPFVGRMRSAAGSMRKLA